MKFTRILALAAAMLACSIPVAVAEAAPVTVTGPGLAYAPNLYYYGSVTGDLSTPYTNATTTPTIVTGMSVSVPATKRTYAVQYICVRWSADATKGTATTGSIGVNVNGAVDTTSYRFTSSAAGRNSLNGSGCYQRSSAAAQTVSLVGVSADTNTLTVNNAYMEVWNITLQQ